MNLLLPSLMVTLAIVADGGSLDGPRDETPSRELVPLSVAVEKFNEKNSEKAIEAKQDPLTEAELLAALINEKEELSDECATIADEIIKTKSIPTAVKLVIWRRRFVAGHATYLYHIVLILDKGPASPPPEKYVGTGDVAENGRSMEQLTVRKRYLASQSNRSESDLLSLDELLDQSND